LFVASEFFQLKVQMQRYFSKIALNKRSKQLSSIVGTNQFLFLNGTVPSRNLSGSNEHADIGDNFLHISPSGDWWTGGKMYAAKHLPSDYVKSLLLPEGFNVDSLQNLPFTTFVQMYDDGKLDKSISGER
jgi:hypothetical protein